MAFKHQGGGDMSHGQSRVSKRGWYHMVIERVDDPAKKFDGTPISNTAFGLQLKVLAGTNVDQVDKTQYESFFFPDAGEPFKSADAVFVAVGAMTPAQVIAKEPVEIDLPQLAGRQLIVELVDDNSEKNKGKGYLKAWSNYYHVDDPAGAQVPRDAKMLGYIRPELRLINKSPAYFAGREEGRAMAAASTTEREL